MDHQLASGAAVTLLARKYDLSEQTITEHRNKHLGIQRRPRFDRYGDTPDSLIDELTTLKATAEARLSVCGDDHKSAAALIRESRCIDEAVAFVLTPPYGSVTDKKQCLAITAYPSDSVTLEVALFPASHNAVSVYSRCQGCCAQGMPA
jgi:hypothetical protein